LALDCLQMAVRLGYRNAAQAKVDPDLKNIREAPATRAAFQKLFP